jgi:hypothetical protein
MTLRSLSGSRFRFAGLSETEPLLAALTELVLTG